MPKYLAQYRVFMASPSGLKSERELFRDTLEKYSDRDAEPRGVTFLPVGWEDTIGGAGRPQELINEDLKQCDYAVFVLHNRWGSPTGAGYSSGTEEEWKLAEQLYKETKIRNIALFFKEVEPAQLNDPGPQLAEVIEFKRQIESGKKYLFKSYMQTGDFGEKLERYLASWLRDHEKGTANAPASGGHITITSPDVPASITTVASEPYGPDFNFWITEAKQLLEAETPDNFGALFCAKKAEATAGSDNEWARAKNSLGAAQFGLNNLNEALAAFREIGKRFNSASEVDEQIRLGTALCNEGLTLGQLGRKEEAIAVFDDVITRFGSAPELLLREQVAKAVCNKGVAVSDLGRNEEAIAVYDDVVNRFGSATELPLREMVTEALDKKLEQTRLKEK
jgi:tetratricopeptide (TPR) repeat protein